MSGWGGVLCQGRSSAPPSRENIPHGGYDDAPFFNSQATGQPAGTSPVGTDCNHTESEFRLVPFFHLSFSLSTLALEVLSLYIIIIIILGKNSPLYISEQRFYSLQFC